MTPGPAEGDDIVDAVARQHEEIRRLFDSVASTGGAERAEQFQCLVRLLAVHETAEEEIVHPVARRTNGEGGDSSDDDGDAAEIVDRLLAQERDAQRAVADLERMGPDGDDFVATLADVRAAVLAHAEVEEREELPILARSGDAARRAALADQFALAERIAPTHAHPHSPTGALGNLVVGPFAAIADRVRDALSGRR